MYQQIALQLAQQVDPALAEQMASQITGQPAGVSSSGGAAPEIFDDSDKESGATANARQQAEDSIMPM